MTSEKLKFCHFGHFEVSKADVLTLKIHYSDFTIFSNVNKILPIIDPVFILYYRIFSWQKFQEFAYLRPIYCSFKKIKMDLNCV